MKRTGNCFDGAIARILAWEGEVDMPMTLVHGLPMGQSGDAALAGRFPHAWIEIDDINMCWDPNSESWHPKHLYYELGQINYTVRYSVGEMRKMMVDKGTYGPWDEGLLARDAEIDKLISESERAL